MAGSKKEELRRREQSSRVAKTSFILLGFFWSCVLNSQVVCYGICKRVSTYSGEA